jgi:hypothetical protein
MGDNKSGPPPSLALPLKEVFGKEVTAPLVLLSKGRTYLDGDCFLPSAHSPIST